MSEHDCSIEFYDTDILFGDDWTCPTCGTVWETDWDYTNAEEGCMAQWLVKQRKGG